MASSRVSEFSSPIASSEDLFNPFYPPSSSQTALNKPDFRFQYREAARTPSPTPSEAAALAGQSQSSLAGLIKKLRDPEYWKDPKNVATVLTGCVFLALAIAFLVEQDNIINALKPASHWLKTTPGAWLIPIAIMIAMSFPPLFGHEIVAIFCGIVWGIGEGFAIVAAGTIIGEICTYLAFKFCCVSRVKKMEEKSLSYALTAEVIRQGGLKVAVIARFSAIPGHLTTAVFATAGLSFWTFLIAAVLGLPKQLVVVYLGVSDNDDENGGTVSKKTKLIKWVIIAATVLVTIFAMRYINSQTERVKQQVIYKRRKARQASFLEASSIALSNDPVT